MKIICGEFEVYHSGTLDCPDLSDTKFVISENPPMEIVVRVSYSTDSETGISIELLGDNTLGIIFNKPTGLAYGPAKPIKVGLLNGRSLYISARLSMRGDNSSYGLDYTFYLKDAA